MARKPRTMARDHTLAMLALRGTFNAASGRYEQEHGAPGLTNPEIANALGVSRSWVYQQIGPQPSSPESVARALDVARERLSEALGYLTTCAAQFRTAAHDLAALPEHPATADDACAHAVAIDGAIDTIRNALTT